MDLEQWLILVAGLVVLGYSVWCRAGRSGASRYWVGRESLERGVLIGFPGLALMLIAGSVLSAVGTRSPLLVPLALVCLVGVVGCLWGALTLPLASWMQPEWFRVRTGYRAEARKKLATEKRAARVRRKADSGGA